MLGEGTPKAESLSFILIKMMRSYTTVTILFEDSYVYIVETHFKYVLI